MAGGVSGYAAISAKVRAMYSNLLTPQDISRLSESPDFSSLISALKHTQYGPYLSALKDNELTPRRAVQQIKRRLADTYASVVQMSPTQARPLIRQLYRSFELGNLKAVLRSIVTVSSSWNADEAPWDRVREVLFPFGSFSTLPAQAMVESGSVASAVELLKGTPYESAISFALRRFSAEQNLFPIEVALDLDYWRRLWTEARKLKGLDREAATKIIGSLLDMNNLMWTARYKIYHKLSEEELINYTLPFGFRAHDDDIRAIAAGADAAAVISRIFPTIPDVAALLEKPHTGLPKLEVQIKRQVIQQCAAAFIGNPFHVGLPLAFLILSDLEIQDLIALIEAKSSDISDEELHSALLKTALQN
ncbi:MAG: V-type ATPase subunit [Anaerolineales bacterium]|nr:V-type ATPase subunit [Anaerolineales bacterium]MCL4259112.1 V-type ATPase subunit [Anaerolineales bacterium]